MAPTSRADDRIASLLLPYTITIYYFSSIVSFYKNTCLVDGRWLFVLIIWARVVIEDVSLSTTCCCFVHSFITNAAATALNREHWEWNGIHDSTTQLSCQLSAALCTSILLVLRSHLKLADLQCSSTREKYTLCLHASLQHKLSDFT